MEDLVVKPAGNAIAPVHIDQYLNDGDILPIAGGVQVVHTPGHSAGHISLLVKDAGVLMEMFCVGRLMYF